MKAETKILRLVHPENGGPRIRRVLDMQARRYGEGEYLIDYMIAKGVLAIHGFGKGATWGLPKKQHRAAENALKQARKA